MLGSGLHRGRAAHGYRNQSERGPAKGPTAQPEQISPKALLVEDLGVSSLDRFELLMGLEEEFGIELPEQDQDQMKSVGDIIAYIEQHMTKA